MTDENIPVESLENEGTDTQPHAVFDDAITHHCVGCTVVGILNMRHM